MSRKSRAAGCAAREERDDHDHHGQAERNRRSIERPMIVLCTGMIRSGSTWSFNVVKRLLGRISTSVYGEYSDAVGQSLLSHGDGYEHRVIKCHAPDVFGRM